MADAKEDGGKNRRRRRRPRAKEWGQPQMGGDPSLAAAFGLIPGVPNRGPGYGSTVPPQFDNYFNTHPQIPFSGSGDDFREPRNNVSAKDFFAGTGYTPPGSNINRNNGPIDGSDVREPMPRPDRGRGGGDIRGGQPDGISPLEQLTQLATELITQAPPSYDYESAMQEAAQGIRQAYGAEINAIRQNNRVARRSTKRAKKEIGNLYEGLAKLYGKQEARALNRAEKASDAQMDIANEGNTILQDLNNRMIEEEAELLANLNAGQAAPEVISPDFDRMGEQVAENTERGQSASSLALRQGENNARWFDRAEGGANLEGTNRQADLISQLASFVMGNRQQIAGLKGSRARDVAASNASIQAQAAQASGDAHQQMIENVMDLMSGVSDIEDTNIDNAREDAKFRWKKKTDRRDAKLENRKFLASLQEDAPSSIENYAPGIKDAISIVAGNPDPHDEKAMALLYQLFGSNAWETGQVPSQIPGETNDLTPFKAMAIARKLGMKKGLRGEELNEFVNAAAASVG